MPTHSMLNTPGQALQDFRLDDAPSLEGDEGASWRQVGRWASCGFTDESVPSTCPDPNTGA